MSLSYYFWLLIWVEFNVSQRYWHIFIITLLTIVNLWNHLHIYQKRNKMCHIHTIKFYSANRKNKLLFVEKWVKLVIILRLFKLVKMEKDKYQYLLWDYTLLQPVTMAKINDTVEADDGEDPGEEEHLPIVGIGTMEISVMFSPKAENWLATISRCSIILGSKPQRFYTLLLAHSYLSQLNTNAAVYFPPLKILSSSIQKKRQEYYKCHGWWMTPRKKNVPDTTELMQTITHRDFSTTCKTWTGSRQTKSQNWK